MPPASLGPATTIQIIDEAGTAAEDVRFWGAENSDEQGYAYEFTVPRMPRSIANGHANNVEFVRWMQDAAAAHADAAGCTAATLAAGATWVVRSHRIEYRRPALAGERLRVVTWVETSAGRFRYDGTALSEPPPRICAARSWSTSASRCSLERRPKKRGSHEI